MGTKFSHDSGVRGAREARRTPYRRVAQRGYAPRGVRGVLWVVGIALAGVLIVFMTTLYQRPGPRRFPVREGRALVLEKIVDAPGTCALRLRILSGSRAVATVVHPVTGEFCATIEEGDLLAVLYHPAGRSKPVKIVDTGRFALSDEIQ